MAITSPRAAFRAQPPVPLALPDQRTWLVLLSRAIRFLQENARKHPVEVRTVSATYTMLDIDSMILAGATAADVSVFLLTAAGREGQVISVKKTDSSSNLVVIDPAGSETVDGSTTISLSSENACWMLQSDGTNWRVLSALGTTTAI